MGSKRSVHSDPEFLSAAREKSKQKIQSPFNRTYPNMEFEFSLAAYYETSRPKKKLKTSNHSLRHYKKNEEEKEEEEEEEEEEKGETGPGSDSGREQEQTCDVARKWRSEEYDYDEGDVSSRDGGKGKEVYVESSCDEVRVRDFGEGTNMSRYECYEEVHRKDFHEDSEGGEEEPENIIPESIKKTSRLALLDMDWTQVKAADLYTILSSFLPKDGKILRVAIYPSEYGVRKMEEEEEVQHSVGVIDDENDNSDHIDEEKLHAEEKRRLRYYYAAVECDCMKTANYIYNTCDVAGFERASMRYIPHCMEYKYPALDVAIGDDNELDRSRTFDQVAADIFGEEPSVEESSEGAERKGEEERRQQQDTETEANANGAAELGLLPADDSGMENG